MVEPVFVSFFMNRNEALQTGEIWIYSWDAVVEFFKRRSLRPHGSSDYSVRQWRGAALSELSGSQ
jgi:hypothetical protein